MKLAELFGRATRARRTLLTVGLQAAIALTIGAGVVLASSAGGDRGISVRVNGPVPRALHATTAGPGNKVIVGHSYYQRHVPSATGDAGLAARARP